jgi:hypothetical protein
MSLADWLALKRAVAEAQKTGTTFRISGAAVVIEGADAGLEQRLTEGGLLWAYLGADSDDVEAANFLAELNVEPVLVTDRSGALAAVKELSGKTHLGLDIETEHDEPCAPIAINRDGSVSAIQPKLSEAGLDPIRRASARCSSTVGAGGASSFAARPCASSWVRAGCGSSTSRPITPNSNCYSCGTTRVLPKAARAGSRSSARPKPTACCTAPSA